jgi:hypothetical protein
MLKGLRVPRAGLAVALLGSSCLSSVAYAQTLTPSPTNTGAGERRPENVR